MVTLEDLTIEPEHLPFTERKRKGLLQRNPQKAEYILKVERVWEKYALAFGREQRAHLLDSLLREFQFVIQKKAKAMARKWGSKKIPEADFEHAFWITAWQLCEERYNHYTEFYLYETLLLALERKGMDIIRKHTKTKKRALNTASVRLHEKAAYLFPSDEDIEKQVTDRMLVEQILSDEVLTSDERLLLETIYQNPDLSYRAISREIGTHHEQVKRNLERIRRKLQHYKYYFD